MLSHGAVLVIIGSRSLVSSQSPLFLHTSIFFLSVNQINQTGLATTLILPSLALFFAPSVRLLQAPPTPNLRFSKRSVPSTAYWVMSAVYHF